MSISFNELSYMDDLVHMAITKSYNDLDKALDYVDEAFKDKDCCWIEHCVRETVMRWFMLSRPREKDVYSWFRQNYKSKLGNNFEIVKKESNSKNIPDFWLYDGETEIPVECKIGDFNKWGLAQLQRYMNVYQCEKGVAVGNTLSVELPENITFVQFDIKELMQDE